MTITNSQIPTLPLTGAELLQKVKESDDNTSQDELTVLCGYVDEEDQP